MKVPNLDLRLKVQVTDKNGKVVSTIEKKSESFVLQFLQFIQVQLMQTGVSIKDNTNTARNVIKYDANLKGLGLVNDDTDGILVGTGTTTPTNTDYVMETLIDHGVGATQLSYGSQSIIAAQEVGANVDFQVVRAFLNSSGGTINVTEAGLQVIGRYSSTYADFLIIHDVFGAVAVADGETITVTYTLRTTV